MNALISALAAIVFILAWLAQTNAIPPMIGYGIAIPLALVTFGLAIVRYRGRKADGE